MKVAAIQMVSCTRLADNLRAAHALLAEAAQGGARTLKDLRRELGVTRDCGRCATCAHECLREAHATQGKTSPAMLRAA